METTNVVKRPTLTNEEVSRLLAQRVFFGHQSVGDNIIQGIRDLAVNDPRLRLNIVSTHAPEVVPGPALIETHIGENGKPQSKDDAFASILEKGMGLKGVIAMYKYCYVDIDAATDVQRMFERYRDGIAALKHRYPSLRIVHFTVPLTTVEPTAKAWIKALLGRPTSREANMKRNLFNELLKQAYRDKDPIFDLAEVESTHIDGSRCYFTSGGENVYTLVPEFTTDGGHLNEAGRRAAAERLLLLLATL